MNERRQCMQSIYELGFAMDEAILFLDTHPCDQAALDYYNLIQQQYHRVYEEYQKKFGPLNARDVNCNNKWTWTELPWPWELEGC